MGDFPDTLGSSGLIDFKKSPTLLTKWGFNIGAVGKYTVDSLGHARVTGGFNYNSFTGSKDYSRPNGTRTYKNRVSIFTFSAGIEYNFSPKKKVNPFAGVDLAANLFSGKIEASGDTLIILDRRSETRFGIIATAGVDIRLNKDVGIVIGVKYSLANLIGKETETVVTTTSNPNFDDEEGGTLVFEEIPLNDAETSSNRSKTINYVQFYVGLSIYLGKIVGK